MAMNKTKGRIRKRNHQQATILPRRLFPGIAALLSTFMLASPAWAIPSPDLVISFFSNAAQFFGLLTVAAGSVVFFRQRDLKDGVGATSGAGNASGTMRWAFKILCLLLLVSVAANVLLWASQTDDRNRRLQANLTRSSTEDGKTVGDTSLKTLSYSDQVDHPQGMTSDELAALMASAEGQSGDVTFIDLREPEEKEVGQMEGFTPVRFPDFLANADKEALKNGQTVLLCYSGNRSSETCERLAALGIPCKFLVGGFEKWQTEGRPVSRPANATVAELRALPAYPNKDMLLDTDDVRALVQEEEAIFIDVRYSGDFERDHLPGAINIPLRKLQTSEILRRLEQVPKKPIVAPCYDKRSCFYSQILGLRLYRYGHDFRGRYTVPAEYNVLPTALPHVETWLVSQQNSVFGMISRPIASALSGLDGILGNLVLAIVALSIAMRFLLAPFTIKAERDRLTQEAIAPDVARLKAALRDNPRRLSRALRKIYQKNGLTPLRNMLGVALQVPLFIILFLVVEEVSAGSADILPWIGAVGVADPSYLLPVSVGLLAAVLLHLHWRKTSAVVWAIKLSIVGLLMFLCVNLNVGVNIYLITGLVIMIAQTIVVSAWMKRREEGATFQRRANKSELSERIVPLSQAGRLKNSGRKAARLGEMAAVGLPVPAGFVIPHSVVGTASADGSIFASRDLRVLDRVWRRQGHSSVAVRSSGLAEDGGDYSYAGVFESILDVDRDGLEDAVSKVRKSICEPLTETYGADAPVGGGIIVQEMVQPDYAGILFTEHPTECGSILIELAADTADGVTSGSVDAVSYRYGRYSGRLLDEKQPPIDLRPLIELARRAERMFGCPQDIEWVYRNGRYQLLQSRDITHLARNEGKKDSATRLFEEERHRLLQLAPTDRGEKPVLAQNDLAELLPQPTPSSLSLMQRLWAPGGSRDIACQALGIPYEVDETANPIVETAFGWLYVNAHEESAALSKGPGVVASFKLARSAEILERDFREGFLPNFLYETRQREAIDLSRLNQDELLEFTERSIDRFVHDVYVQADIINIAASFYLRLAEQELQRRGLSAPTHIAQTEETIVHRAMALLPDIQDGSLPVSRFIDLFGHRAPIDYELAQPRYEEDPALVDNLVKLAGGGKRTAKSHKQSLPASAMSGTLALSLDRAQKFQILKEEAKHYCLRELAVIRRMLLEVDRQFDLDGSIFHLKLDEIALLGQSEEIDGLRKQASQRMKKAEVFQKLGSLPSQISLSQLESLQRDGDAGQAEDDNAPLRGSIVAGDRTVKGRARIVDDKQQLANFADGDIVVGRYIPAELAPIIGRAGAIVTELGGWLSHTSILARELNVTAVVGAKNVAGRITDGEMIQVGMNGDISRLDEPMESEIVEFPERSVTHKQKGRRDKQALRGIDKKTDEQKEKNFKRGAKS